MPALPPAAPTIMIIRHAEKPPNPPQQPPPFGVTHTGQHDEDALTVRGWQRAGALVGFFASPQHPLLTTPQFIYATKIKANAVNRAVSAEAAKKENGSKSRRPQETVTPLIEKLGANITVNFKIDKGEEAKLAKSAQACSGGVLICWQHELIPVIATYLPISAHTPVPKTWPLDAHGNSRFDLVWVFVLDAPSGKYSFTQIPQCLLSGDSPD